MADIVWAADTPLDELADAAKGLLSTALHAEAPEAIALEVVPLLLRAHQECDAVALGNDEVVIADDSGNGEVSKNELESCLARRSKFRAFVTWLLRDFRGRTVDLTGLTQQVRVYLREVHDDDALTAVARRPDDTYPSVTPPRVSHDDSSLDGSIRIEISSR